MANIDYDVVTSGEDNKKIQVFLPGAGDGDDFYAAQNAIQNSVDNGNSASVIMPKFPGLGVNIYYGEEYNNKYSSDAISAAIEYANQHGISTQNMSVSGMSDGGYLSLYTALYSLKDNNPQYFSNVFILDGYSNFDDFLGDSFSQDVSLLKQNGVSVYTLSLTNINNYREYPEVSEVLTAYAKNGVNVMHINCLLGGHSSNYLSMYKSGLIGFLDGTQDSFDYSLYGTNKVMASIYDPTLNNNQGGWREMSLEEFIACRNENLSVTHTSALKELNTTLQSSESELDAYLNDIRSLIKNSTFLNSVFNTFSSTTEVPNKESTLIEELNRNASELLYKLSKDTEMISELGKSIAELDDKLSKVIENNLPEGKDLSTVLNSYSSPAESTSNSNIGSGIVTGISNIFSAIKVFISNIGNK